MKTANLILVTVLVAFKASGQALKKLQPSDRPVFMSASHLALLCEDWGLHTGGKPPKDTDTLKVSMQEIVRSTACDAHIAGVNDGRFEEK